MIRGTSALAGRIAQSRNWRPRWGFRSRTCSEGRVVGQENEDYNERETRAILEPENLVPLVVMAIVGGLFALRLVAVSFGWADWF